MDQGTDGRWAFHCIRQPDMERELPGLSDRTAENQQRNEGRAGANGKKSCVFQTTAPLIVKQECAAAVIEPKHPEKKPEVTDAGGDEGFLGCGSGARPIDPEPNEQIGSKPD